MVLLEEPGDSRMSYRHVDIRGGAQGSLGGKYLLDLVCVSL